MRSGISASTPDCIISRYNSPMSLRGKRILITGGSRGIGRAIAIRLAGEGAVIGINYLRNTKAAEETANLVKEAGAEAYLYRGNVGNVENIKEIFEKVRSDWGGLYGLVNNAVLGVLRPVDEFPEKGWEMTMDTNAKAMLFCSQEAAKLMKDGGAIVSLSSIGSHHCLPGYSVLGASKAVIETLTRYLALELGPKGIRANAVSGGPVDTEALRTFPNYEDVIAHAKQHTPLGRMGTPEDIAKVVVWLFSDDAGWVTGQTIIVDGGLTLW